MGDVKSIGASRVEKSGDNTDWSPVECLREAISDIENGKASPDKVMVIMLSDGDDGYEPGWYASKLRASEMIALTEIVKSILIRSMEF